MNRLFEYHAHCVSHYVHNIQKIYSQIRLVHEVLVAVKDPTTNPPKLGTIMIYINFHGILRHQKN